MRYTHGAIAGELSESGWIEVQFSVLVILAVHHTFLPGIAALHSHGFQAVQHSDHTHRHQAGLGWGDLAETYRLWATEVDPC